MKTKNYAVILAGGRGERFWPVGRASRPKQFVSIFGNKPLIAHAVDRLKGLLPESNILVVTSGELVETTRAALPMLAPENIYGEPEGRDTAAACAFAAGVVAARGGEDACMCILTADQLIADIPAFRRILGNAFSLVAKQPVMSLIGIKPTFPATGYGYVKVGASGKKAGLPAGCCKVDGFVEKPNLGTAAMYLEDGHYLWNSGMFVWRVDTFLEAVKKFCPKVYRMQLTLRKHFGTPRFSSAMAKEYAKLEKISVDYAVMEKSVNLVAFKGNFGWDDVGTWVSAGEHFEADEQQNSRFGLTSILAASGNTIVNTREGHLVAVMGASDLVVVHTEDATLICSKEAADGLKALVRELAANPGTKHFTE